MTEEEKKKAARVAATAKREEERREKAQKAKAKRKRAKHNGLDGAKGSESKQKAARLQALMDDNGLKYKVPPVFCKSDPCQPTSNRGAGFYYQARNGVVPFLGPGERSAAHYILTGEYIPAPTPAQCRAARNPNNYT